jgi:hypothetical protein
MSEAALSKSLDDLIKEQRTKRDIVSICLPGKTKKEYGALIDE